MFKVIKNGNYGINNVMLVGWVFLSKEIFHGYMPLHVLVIAELDLCDLCDLCDPGRQLNKSVVNMQVNLKVNICFMSLKLYFDIV